ncbi:MAG: uroporphyrinogen-III synthase [Alphaproteobacteria bacterium]|nr:uroporphyrinogen-III synthase [Alphaproteobacteria bacterium]
MQGVLITRPQQQAEVLAEKLKRDGFDPVIAPLLDYAPLHADFDRLDRFQALIFTSTEAVRAFAVAEKGGRGLPAFCVGDETARVAGGAGFHDVRSASGDGEMLLRLLRESVSDDKLSRLLHVCGADTARDFRNDLEKDDVTVEKLQVYEAVLATALPVDAERRLKAGTIDAVLLFSARAARRFCALLEDGGMKNAAKKITLVCMSPRIAAEAGGLPWQAVRVAEAPTQDAVMDVLHALDGVTLAGDAPPPLAAEPVIEAFGGLRPLAQTLDIPPSTVQGWRARGVVPEARVDAILGAAEDMGVNPEELLRKASRPMAEHDEDDLKDGQKEQAKERRKGRDRRVRRTAPDAQGNVRTAGYSGKDRRTGEERRAFEAHQRKVVWREKMDFLNRTTVSITLLLAAIIYAGYFLLAPELVEMDAQASRVAALEKRMESLHHDLRSEQKKSASLSAMMSRKVIQMQDAKDDVVSSAEDVTTSVRKAVKTFSPDVDQVTHLLSGLSALRATPEGRATLGRAMQTLGMAVDVSASDPESLNNAVDLARKRDPALGDMFEKVSTDNLAAAALLLGMNEMRVKMNRQQSYKHDLLLVRKIAGKNVGMQKALDHLTPYAESGVLSRSTLQKEFKGLAGDIVMAKLQGEDLSVQEQALKRMRRFVKVRKVDDTESDTVDAKVAKAQILLDQGNVKDAMAVLHTLEGAPAEAAAPWMQAAAGHVVADDTSGMLSEAILQSLTQTAAGNGFTLDNLTSIFTSGFESMTPPPVIYMSPAMQQGGSGGFPAR